MKISFISNIFPPHVRGGYELGCQSIARAFARRGHEVEILTSASTGQLARAGSETTLPVHEIFEPVYWYEESLDQRAKENGNWRRSRAEAFGGLIIGNVLALENHFRLHQADVIWMFNPLGLGTIGILETILAFPARCLITLMDNIDTTVSHYQQRIFMEARYRRAKRQISAISCSRKTLIDNQQIGTYRSHRVIYNAIDFSAVPNSRRQSLLGKTRFVYFGQVAEAKGVLQVIRGAAALLRSQPAAAFEIDIIGRASPDFANQMAAEVSSQGLENFVKLTGFTEREALMSRLQTYDAAIMLLSDAEPFAYSVLEAAAAGLTVVLTSGSGNAESFPDGYPLLVKDREDSLEIAAIMARCIENREWSANLARSLQAHLCGLCDFNSAAMPAYTRTMLACPVNPGRNNIRSSLSNFATANLFSDS